MFRKDIIPQIKACRHLKVPRRTWESLNHQMNINSDSKPVARKANIVKNLKVPLIWE